MASGENVGFGLMPMPPGSNPATFDTRASATSVENFPIYDFDDTTIEYMDFYGFLYGYDGGGLTVKFPWTATSATSSNVIWGAAFRRIQEDAEDIDLSQTYDYNDASAQAPGSASGEQVMATITFTNGADMDSLADTEPFVLRIRRNASSGSDTMAGDAELWFAGLRVMET